MSSFGLNLRLEWLDSLIEEKPAIDCLQLIADNWLTDGPHHKKLETLRQDYSISFHCVGMNLAGFDQLNLEYLKNIKKLMDKFQPCRISDHLAIEMHNGICYHDLLPFPMNAVTLQHISTRINQIQSFFNHQLLVENLSSYISFSTSHDSEAVFLKKIVEKTSCGLLLDVNNIYVNYLNGLGDPDEYILHIPFDAVQEIHVAGGEWVDSVFVDTHGTFVSNEVLSLLNKVYPLCKQAHIIYERDKNIPPLHEVVEEVDRIRFKVSKAGIYSFHRNDFKTNELVL
ncbi:MAG: DUF692 domain-containing protein [Oligoflexales bacterium]